MRLPLPLTDTPPPVTGRVSPEASTGGSRQISCVPVLGTQAAAPKVGGGRWTDEWTVWVVHTALCLSSFPRVPYLAVARTFEKIEEVSAR